MTKGRENFSILVNYLVLMLLTKASFEYNIPISGEEQNRIFIRRLQKKSSGLNFPMLHCCLFWYLYLLCVDMEYLSKSPTSTKVSTSKLFLEVCWMPWNLLPFQTQTTCAEKLLKEIKLDLNGLKLKRTNFGQFIESFFICKMGIVVVLTYKLAISIKASKVIKHYT